MWFRHTRTRLVTAGAAFAALTAVVPVACAALDDSPSAPAQRSPARTMAPFGSGHACAQTRLVHGTALPDGAPLVVERRFGGFTGQPPPGRPDMQAVPDRRVVPDGRKWWREGRSALTHGHPRVLVLALHGSEARSRGAPGAHVRRTHKRRHGHGPVGAVTRPEEPVPAGSR